MDFLCPTLVGKSDITGFIQKYLSACVNLRRFLKQSFESLLGIMLACVETVLMTVR